MNAVPLKAHTVAVAVLVLASVLFCLSWGCGEAGKGPSFEAPKQVEGVVVKVAARDLREVETLQVRDEQGRVWTFTTRGFAGLTPGHLREHQLFGSPVTVYYEEEGEGLVAVRVTDPAH